MPEVAAQKTCNRAGHGRSQDRKDIWFGVETRNQAGRRDQMGVCPKSGGHSAANSISERAHIALWRSAEWLNYRNHHEPMVDKRHR